MDSTTYSAMQGSEPIVTYKKTILAKVCITVWDSFNEKQDIIILSGDPRKDEDTCMWDIFTEKEDFFFKRMNKTHFNSGTIISYKRPEVVEVVREEQFSDEQLLEIVNLKYLALINKINNITSVPVMFRIVDIAKNAEKSEKIVRVLEGRLAELEAEGFANIPSTLETEV